MKPKWLVFVEIVQVEAYWQKGERLKEQEEVEGRDTVGFYTLAPINHLGGPTCPTEVTMYCQWQPIPLQLDRSSFLKSLFLF